MLGSDPEKVASSKLQKRYWTEAEVSYSISDFISGQALGEWTVAEYVMILEIRHCSENLILKSFKI